MSTLINGGQSKSDSNSQLTPMSRQSVIELGVEALNEAGSESICKVCIKYGGSCCIGCRHLVNGLGCTTRNTSCTAWLCGYLKFVLYATSQHEQWNEFWKQVPGQSYREDDTPAYFTVEKSLDMRTSRKLGEALGADLQELATKHREPGYIPMLRDKIDYNIDRLNHCKHDPRRRARTEKNIRTLSSPFHRFHNALQEYHQRIGESE